MALTIRLHALSTSCANERSERVDRQMESASSLWEPGLKEALPLEPVPTAALG